MDLDNLHHELRYKAVRSSGAGGQHVNKVSSKVELSFDIPNSQSLSDYEKLQLKKTLSNRLTKEGVLKLSSGESRSQHTNKEKVTKRLVAILIKGLEVQKKRKPTQISGAQKQKRLNQKKIKSEKKDLRKKPSLD